MTEAELPVLPETQAPWPARGGLRITRVRAIVTAPEGPPLVVVRIDTNEPGLYGLGCATFTQRFTAVVATIEQHVAPMLIGRHPADIEDIFRMVHFSSYWRNGPVTNNALAGVDLALWDIAGKRAGMPVYELLGGRVRTAAQCYIHAGGATVAETLDQAREFMAAGYRHIRLQVGQPGLGAYGAPAVGGGYPGQPYPDGWDVQQYLRTTPALFAAARAELGEEVELLHDVHSRLTPKQVVLLARALEPYRLFFLEDVVAPEEYDRLPQVRADSPVPIAVGEQVSSVADATRLVLGGGVDLLRLHITAVGGLTPTRKLVALCELTGVKTAWHAPADVSPIGAAANVALDVTTPAFGIQEGHEYNDAAREVFPGTLVTRDGYLYPNDAPGWGIELDERAAAKYPPVTLQHERWSARVRRPDGGIEAP
ncbi:enolase C-terminal domain-like protein [Micromonospora sp. NBC_01796]|uniref:enolase C-terminal domain-like protein n=1 Tax=Micromonospora sp. NBC_01796 TaxID=2975987 RepID=UPI002DD91E45|nr:enolase C-terminal domain-like protein [Micromonospora sp. NBC_01796]WSA84658.1 starvation-sensing protein RspA [Micromonospora sp. NBC_01796]